MVNNVMFQFSLLLSGGLFANLRIAMERMTYKTEETTDKS